MFAASPLANHFYQLPAQLAVLSVEQQSEMTNSCSHNDSPIATIISV